MRARHLRGFLLGVTTVLGCSAPDLTEDVNRYGYLLNEVNLMLCNCLTDLGNPDVECPPSLDLLTQLQIDCLGDALDGHEREGLEYLDCANEALDDYVQCVTSNVSCDADANESCTAAYTMAVGSCPQLDADVHAAFEACKA